VNTWLWLAIIVIMKSNQVLMKKGEAGQSLIGFWTIVIPSVSIKDRSLLVPLVMLNACLTFSWPNKVPFNREASDTIRAEINSDWQIGAEGGMTGTRKVSPRCVLAVGRSLGSAIHDCYPTAT
jgi:hypothetical protein